jgi:chromate transporter
MNSDANPVLDAGLDLRLMSLFAVGGANSAIPEMHRIAVDVQHWMTDKQFADVFAISQLSPGPNVLIVTLIGYSVAGVAGALVATLAMCLPTAVLAYYVSRFCAIEPVALARDHSGGAGSAFDRPDGRQRPDPGADLRQSWVAGLITAAGRGGAGLRLTRLNPLWMLLAGIFPGIIG